MKGEYQNKIEQSNSKDLALRCFVQVLTPYVLFAGFDTGFAGNYPHMNFRSRGTGHVGELDGPGLIIVLIPVGPHPLGLVKP